MTGKYAIIHSNFACIPVAISRLQKPYNRLYDANEIIQDFSETLS